MQARALNETEGHLKDTEHRKTLHSAHIIINDPYRRSYYLFMLITPQESLPWGREAGILRCV